MNIMLSSYFPDRTLLTRKTLNSPGTDIASMLNKSKFRAVFEEIAFVSDAVPKQENLIKEIEMKQLNFNNSHQENTFDHNERDEPPQSMRFIDDVVELSQMEDRRDPDIFYFIDARDILDLSSRRKVDDSNRRKENSASKKIIADNVESPKIEDRRDPDSFYFIDARDILELSSRQKVKVS